MLLSKSRQAQQSQMATLTKKYDTTAFMYTEYPHKNFWSKAFGDAQFRQALVELFAKDKETPIMLYVHFPYCAQLCWFCTCHMSITKEREKITSYLGYLFREIDILRGFLEKNGIKPNFREVHLGGGSPTYMFENEFAEMVKRLGTVVDIKSLDEFALEVDPRQVDEARMKFYHSQGISRISFGVQDFDIKVQKAVNREQPPELIERLLTPAVRKLFKEGVNFDLLCGLPNQTTESLRSTCERVVKMGPDRVCLNYLHYSPQYAPHQNIMIDGNNGRPNRLPDFYERKILFLEAMDVLTKGGYVRTGYDHFAKPTDSVAKAMGKEKMHWNALGVTPGRVVDVLGIGIFSLSTLGDYYFQNFFELPEYEQAIGKGEFAINRGHKLSADDILRRDVIKTLRSYFHVDFKTIEDRYKINFKSYFKDAIVSLDEFIKDEMVEVSDSAITIKEVGHQFANLVCRSFDKYFSGNKLAADLGELTKDKEAVREISAEVKKVIKSS